MQEFFKSCFERCVIFLTVAVLFTVGSLCASESPKPSEVEILLGVQTPVSSILQPPYFYCELDSGGYSDWLWYGLSEIHEYTYHEMLCGEWAAAIYYDGIETDPIDPNDPGMGGQAMWLTNKFIYPDWTTNSNFTVPDNSVCTAWSDPNNPTPEFDTGHTVIANSEVEITIDYEIVDLDSIEEGARSPMTYRYPESSSVFYRNSDRFVTLQTFSIKNIKTSDLENLEFYQLLHSHPADEKSDAIYSIYETQLFSDPLESYIPLNPVHQVGNFHYDITQWNDIDSGNCTVDHVDWLSASTTIEPDVFGHGLFEGHSAGKPPVGTHFDIENRALNSQVYLFNTEPASATGWHIGTLKPDETYSITFAIMFGFDDEVEASLYLEKTAELSSPDSCGVDPSDLAKNEIIYTIEYGYPTSDSNEPNYLPTIQYAELIDELPSEVNFVSASNLDIFSYDAKNHTCTWDIGTIEPSEYGDVTLTVAANTSALPGSNILNRVILTTELGTISDSLKTPVCCWQGTNIYYVDESATGGKTGLSWEDAYTDLQDAFDNLRSGCASEIRVAKGHYNPTNGSGQTPRSFLLVDGVDVYGGFPEGGGSWEERDYIENPTLLCGYYERTGTSSVVDANDMVEGLIFDGFIIANGTSYGISCNSADSLEITNCYIVNNASSGIKCNDANPVISDCVICGNDGSGILCSDKTSQKSRPVINGNKIYYNKHNGINIASPSGPTITNNWILLNGNTYSGGSGITIENSNEIIGIRNNTVIGNLYYGIEVVEGLGPEIENCIVWDHVVDMVGCTATNSCFGDAPDVNGNISDDPEFAFNDPNDYHLSSTSPCIDAGDSWGVQTGEVDLDGDVRTYGTTVDMGVDEYFCSEVTSDADFDLNRKVDLEDYAAMAGSWLESYGINDPNSICDIAPEEKDLIVDLQDLAVLAEDWMWTPCWLETLPTNWIHEDDYLEMLNLIESMCQQANE